MRLNLFAFIALYAWLLLHSLTMAVTESRYFGGNDFAKLGKINLVELASPSSPVISRGSQGFSHLVLEKGIDFLHDFFGVIADAKWDYCDP